MLMRAFIALLLSIKRRKVSLSTFTSRALSQHRPEKRRRAAHRHIENSRSVNLFHGTTVVGEDRQKPDELRDLFSHVCLVDVQTATVIGNLSQCPVRSKVEDVQQPNAIRANTQGTIRTSNALP